MPTHEAERLHSLFIVRVIFVNVPKLKKITLLLLIGKPTSPIEAPDHDRAARGGLSGSTGVKLRGIKGNLEAPIFSYFYLLVHTLPKLTRTGFYAFLRALFTQHEKHM